MLNDWRCIECNWRGPGDAMLTGANPFNVEEGIVGCPQCKCIDQFRMVCDECEQEATCGFPTPAGYRRTCGRHYVPK